MGPGDDELQIESAKRVSEWAFPTWNLSFPPRGADKPRRQLTLFTTVIMIEAMQYDTIGKAESNDRGHVDS